MSMEMILITTHQLRLNRTLNNWDLQNQDCTIHIYMCRGNRGEALVILNCCIRWRCVVSIMSQIVTVPATLGKIKM